MSCCPIHIRANISIHAPPRGATLRANRHVVRLDDFNSRPSARGDTFFISRPCFIGLFQFTPLREGRQTPQKFFLRIILFQFTPLREGRHVSCGCFNGTIDISIHAPPRGATKRISVTLGTKAFQFTPLREGRLHGKKLLLAVLYFNSRPSARGDAAGRARVLRRIHFNSRPSARGDGITLACKPHALVFQFTPLREGRRTRFLCCAHQFYFNSRPSARGDFARLTILYTRLKFQFTPLREGRRHPACQTSIAS